MKLKKQIIFFLLILVVGSSFSNIVSQVSSAKPTRQSSFEAFSKGNYEKAYKEFSDLLLIYPKDPLYKYYSAVCLVKLRRSPGEASSLLQQSLQGASAVKSLPPDALFYLGRAQQMSGEFVEATKTYNLYTQQVGKKIAKDQGVPELIQQSNEKKGKIKEPEKVPVEAVRNEKVDISQKTDTSLMNGNFLQDSEKEISPKKNLAVGYEMILNEALDLQYKADSILSLVREQKMELEKLSVSEKSTMTVKISENELLAASIQKSADNKHNEASTYLNPRQADIKQKPAPQQSDTRVVKNPDEEPGNRKIQDSIKQPDIKDVKKSDKQPDTIKKVVTTVQKPVEIFSIFEVLPKPVTDPKEKISIDPEVPEGLIYRIQIAVFRNPVPPSYFKGITPVYGFKIRGSDKTNYYAGLFRRASDANKALTHVKSKGFKDSFVIALSGNKPVSADRANILEKQWGKKPLMTLSPTIPETVIDTIPPALSFRVEVIKSLKPLKEDVVDGIIKMAGNRVFDVHTLDDGNSIYLIGKFITFESASEYADLLKRNGYREARVVAWLGKREIPVETARQLFEKME